MIVIVINTYVVHHDITTTMLPTYDFPSDKDVLSILKKILEAWSVPLHRPSFLQRVLPLFFIVMPFTSRTALYYCSSFSHSYPVLPLGYDEWKWVCRM